MITITAINSTASNWLPRAGCIRYLSISACVLMRVLNPSAWAFVNLLFQALKKSVQACLRGAVTIPLASFCSEKTAFLTSDLGATLAESTRIIISFLQGGNGSFCIVIVPVNDHAAQEEQPGVGGGGITIHVAEGTAFFHCRSNFIRLGELLHKIRPSGKGDQPCFHPILPG